MFLGTSCEAMIASYSLLFVRMPTKSRIYRHQAIPPRVPNPAPFGILITSAVETPTDSTRRRSKRCVVFLCQKSASTGSEKPFSATRGGMLSGRAASRTGQLSDTASQHTFGGWQGGHHPRWQYTHLRLEIITPAIGDGRPT